MEYTNPETWLAAGYVTDTDEWATLNSLSQIEGISAFQIYNDQNVNLDDLPQPNGVIEFITKKIEDKSNFDNSLEGFRNAYLDDVTLAQGDFIGFVRTDSNFRLNINAYPSLESVVGVGLDILKNPDAGVEHYKDFATQAVIIGYRFD